MKDVEEKIRRICGRLLDERLDSSEAKEYRSQLRRFAAVLSAQQGEWNQPAEYDTHQDVPRQSYRNREIDSADGFAEGLKLFNPKKRDSEKKKD